MYGMQQQENAIGTADKSIIAMAIKKGGTQSLGMGIFNDSDNENYNNNTTCTDDSNDDSAERMAINCKKKIP